MGLIKREVLVRPGSPLTKEQATESAYKYIQSLQHAVVNRRGDGSFIDYFFADIYNKKSEDGTENNEIFRIFTDEAAETYQLTKKPEDLYYIYTLIDNNGNVNENIPGGNTGQGEGVGTNPDDDLEGQWYDDLPIILDWDSPLRFKIEPDADSWERVALAKPRSWLQSADITFEDLQEAFGEEFTYENVRFMLKLQGAFNEDRFVPVYQDDVVEVIDIPVSGYSGYTLSYKQFSIADGNTTIDGIKSKKINDTKVSNWINLGRKPFSGIYALKINGKLVANFTKEQVNSNNLLNRNYMFIDGAVAASTSPFNNIGIVDRLSSGSYRYFEEKIPVVSTGVNLGTAATLNKTAAAITMEPIFVDKLFEEYPKRIVGGVTYRWKYIVANLSTTGSNISDYNGISKETMINVIIPHMDDKFPEWIEEVFVQDRSPEALSQTLGAELIKLLAIKLSGFKNATASSLSWIQDIKTGQVFICSTISSGNIKKKVIVGEIDPASYESTASSMRNIEILELYNKAIFVNNEVLDILEF